MQGGQILQVEEGVVRPLEAGDAKSLVALVERVHGADYYQSAAYDEAQLGASINDGRRRGVVLADTSGLRAVVVCQFDLPSDKVGFINLFMVDREYRGRGVGGVILGALVAECRRSGLVSAYGDTGTTDGVSQRAALSAGGAEVALFFAASNRSMERWHAGDITGPATASLWYRFGFGKDRHATIWLPDEHSEILTALYSASGLRRSFYEAGSPELPYHTALDIKAGLGTATAILRARVVGRDCRHAVDDAATALEQRGIVTVRLQMPLNGPETAAVAGSLAAVGFGFAGFIPQHPLHDGRDVICLQRISVPTRDGEITTVSPLATTLAEVVLADLRRSNSGRVERLRCNLRALRQRVDLHTMKERPNVSEARVAWRDAIQDGSIRAATRRETDRKFDISNVFELLDPVLISRLDFERHGATAVEVGRAVDGVVEELRNDDALATHLLGGPVSAAPGGPHFYRLDGVAGSEGPRIFELNAGAVGAFNTQDLINASVMAARPDGGPPGQAPSLLNGVVTCIEKLHSSQAGAGAAPPHVAIVTSHEIRERVRWIPSSTGRLASGLRAAGWRVRVCEPEDLRLRGDRLRIETDGWPVDVVLRLTLPTAANFQAILDAERLGSVLYFNPPRPHSAKAILERVDHPAVPWTMVVSHRKAINPDGDRVGLVGYACSARERLVLKPSYGYGGRGVSIGSEISQSQWEGLVRRAAHDYAGGRRWVVQERLYLPEQTFHTLEDEPQRVRRYHDTNLFVVGDAFVGHTSRWSETAITNIRGGAGMASILVV